MDINGMTFNAKDVLTLCAILMTAAGHWYSTKYSIKEVKGRLDRREEKDKEQDSRMEKVEEKQDKSTAEIHNIATQMATIIESNSNIKNLLETVLRKLP